MSKWNKEKIDEVFNNQIKQHIKSNLMLTEKELKKLGFSIWYRAIYSKRHGYTGLQDFAKKNGFLSTRSPIGLYNSKEKIDRFFNDNIKEYIKDNIMLTSIKALELSFGGWLNAVKCGKYGYTGLKDFAEKHGYFFSKRKILISPKWSKEKIDDYFEKNIKQYIKKDLLLVKKKIIKLGYSSWLRAVYSKRHGYIGLQDFAEKHGYKSNRSKIGLYNSKEKIDDYFDKNIKQYIKDERFLKQEQLIELGFTDWLLALYSGKNGYEGLQDFTEKHGYKSNRSKIGLYNSKEKIDDYFEKNIRKYVVDNIMPSVSKLSELGFGSWLLTVQKGKYGYTGLKDFVNKNGLINSQSKNTLNLMEYFQENIKVLCKNNKLPSLKELERLGHNKWYQSTQKYYRSKGKNMGDFYKEVGLSNFTQTRNNDSINDFFYNNILPKIKENNLKLTQDNIKKIGFSKWRDAIFTKKYGYTGLKDFKIKNNLV